MYTVIVILAVIAAILMCGIVLIQESKGGGLASGFADNNSLLGVRKTTDFIEKATWGLAIALVVLSVLSVAFIPGKKVAKNAHESYEQATAAPAAANFDQSAGVDASAMELPAAAEGQE